MRGLTKGECQGFVPSSLFVLNPLRTPAPTGMLRCPETFKVLFSITATGEGKLHMLFPTLKEVF